MAQTAATHPDATNIPEPEMAKRLLKVVAPKLPEGALKIRCSNAMVMLKVSIDETGRVTEAHATSGYDELKEPSITAVRQWTYKPFEKKGHALPVQTQVSIFYLGDGETFPMYQPDGRGGVKGGMMLPLPPECGPGPTIKRMP